jgi:ribulose-bisphosphate carboxylase large chain
VRRDGGAFTAEIAYRASLAAGQLPQLLNLVYGNVSIQPGVQVVDLRLPGEFVRAMPGPRWGVEGIRRLVGARRRPLLATAVKPNGESVAHFARLCRDFALGGGDIVKDDQNLSDRSFAAFKERVARCQEGVEQGNRKTGGRTLYCPIVTAPFEELMRRVELLPKLGVRGALLCPMLIGLDAFRHVAATTKLVLLAHPSLTGVFLQRGHGIEPSLLLGRLFRLLGADASIFPNHGGRFSFSREQCVSIARELRRPWDGVKPSFPMPAGGMSFENLPSMRADYGEDSIFLIGGALLSRPEGVERATRMFLKEISAGRAGFPRPATSR